MPDYVDLHAGQRVRLMSAGSSVRDAYDGTVLSVKDRVVRVDMGSSTDDRLEATAGEQLLMLTDVRGRMFSFRTVMLGAESVPSYILLLTQPEVAIQDDRREYYRQFTSVAPRYCAVLDGKGLERRRLHVLIMDISGGGMQLRSRERVDIGADVRLIFPLDGDPMDLDVTGRVQSVVSEVRAGQFRVHLKFVDISRPMRDRIIKYVFRQQLAEIKRMSF